MSLFAIGDLHFGFGVHKSMDIFGGNWENHAEKIIQNWNAQITQADTVLLPGDISWGMRLEEAMLDLDCIDRLPGKKILLAGNHDYWWKSSAKLEARYPKMQFLKNDTVPYEFYHICGTRGWICPNPHAFTSDDEKIYRREQIRLRLSLDAAMRKQAKDILVMLHFPPMNEEGESSGFTELVEAYPVRLVVYGHFHGAQNHQRAFQGKRNGIEYRLVSSDYLAFSPKRVL